MRLPAVGFRACFKQALTFVFAENLVSVRVYEIFNGGNHCVSARRAHSAGRGGEVGGEETERKKKDDAATKAPA